MAQQRLINKISPVNIQYYGKVVDWTTIEHAHKIDPETLPIVRQLREELARVTDEKDAAQRLLAEHTGAVGIKKSDNLFWFSARQGFGICVGIP